MANPDAAFGFRPVANDGGVYNGQTHLVSFPATNTFAAYIGTVVKLDPAAAEGLTGAQSVAAATGTDPSYGVIVSFEADPADLSLQYRKTLTQRYAQMVRLENNTFEVQETGNIGLAGVGFNADFTGNSGSTVTGFSDQELNSGAHDASNARDLQIVGGVGRPDNDLTTANATWLVKFNDDQSKIIRTGT